MMPQQYTYGSTPAYYSSVQYQVQAWLVPLIVGLMMMVVFLGMVRRLFRGEEVSMPF